MPNEYGRDLHFFRDEKRALSRHRSGRADALGDLVLPERQVRLLQSIVQTSRFQEKAIEQLDIGSSIGGAGISALFAGASGTGKSTAAYLIAEDLDRDLIPVDIGAVVSKYIGETEKYLDAVFEAAEKGSSVILFDEADALFGKRGEVKDAHDRYANIEVASLLRRASRYHGVTVLTANSLDKLDDALSPRFRFVIEFPRPDSAERLQIWERHISSERQAKELDLCALADRFEVTGGGIRNIILQAQIAALGEGVSLEQRHLIQAANDEILKCAVTRHSQTS